MVFASDCRTGQFVADGQFLSNRFAAMKMAPETGAIDRNIGGMSLRSVRGSARQMLRNKASETKIGEVAVADGDAAARGQKAVDRGHQAAEQGGGGKQADGCNLGHGCPLFLKWRSSSASRS